MASTIDEEEANKALWIAGSVIAIVVLALFTNGFGLFNKDDDNRGGGIVTLSIGQAPTLGSAQAPVTIYEFSDFSCPYCAAAAGENQEIISAFKARDASWEAPVPAIIKKYVEAGKVRLVFKYYPGHGSGNAAHLVGWCLNDQDKFWEFHDKAFAQQSDVASLSKMKSLAQEVGADMTRLDACIDAGTYAPLLKEDAAMGAANGVKGTPAFFVNGKMIEGAEGFAVFEQLIEKELS